MSGHNFYKCYYRLNLVLDTSLAIGSGENNYSDKDVIVDNTGTPFIPATAVTGVMRNYIAKKNPLLADKIFGYIRTKRSDKKEEFDTLIRVYDSYFSDGNKDFFITTRDCVALEKKIAVKGKKFDLQAVEPGVKFVGYIELLEDNKEAATAVEDALSALNSGDIRLGSKTSRGYGKVFVEAYKIEFYDVDKWLDFDMYSSESWKNAEKISMSAKPKYGIKVGLKSVGGLSIRAYTTEVSYGEMTMPDYKMLSLHSDENLPVIPGTSWAGAFRARFSEILGQKAAEDLFGFVNEKDNTTQKSKIVFLESVLRNGTYKQITRNAINRFTGATKNGALYTEMTYYYGETELEILFENKPDESAVNALAVCLADLHYGFLSIGGLASIGRGLFEVKTINGKALDCDDVFGFIKEVISGVL